MKRPSTGRSGRADQDLAADPNHRGNFAAMDRISGKVPADGGVSMFGGIDPEPGVHQVRAARSA